MIRESTHAIILAGGLGTRLRPVVSELPKCMAPVNGKPFLHYVIELLIKQGVSNLIFSVGYKHEAIVEYVDSLCNEGNQFKHQFCIEEEPLGTGGAIKQACSMTDQQHTIICNGDTLFDVDLSALYDFHITQASECTLALKPMTHFDRYGVVELNDDGSVQNFREKKWYDQGLINGGIYILDPLPFLAKELPEKFSFEKDYLEQFYNAGKIFGVIEEGYFIDIGIPSDYAKAKADLK